MNTSVARTSFASQLTRIDKARLESFAPLFDIEFLPQDDNTVVLRLRSPQDNSVSEHRVSGERAHVRLLTELCSRTVRWIYYHPGESILCSFLGQTDAKISRIGELYVRWKAEGAPA